MTDGVTLSQFSFQIPRPLQENYVRKRPTRRAALCDGTRPLEPDEGMQNKLPTSQKQTESDFFNYL